MKPIQNTIDYYRGCFYGGAVGDAMGAPGECRKIAKIKDGSITDYTRMTLFTAEGLAIWRVRKETGKTAVTYVYEALLRWLSTQPDVQASRLVSEYGTCSIIDGVLLGFPEIREKRNSDPVSVSALKTGLQGTMENPVNNSRDCSCVVRSAPAGLMFKPEIAFHMGAGIAAITHGHESAFLSAGCFSGIISEIIHNNRTIVEAVESISRYLKIKPSGNECLETLTTALEAARHKEPTLFSNPETATDVLGLAVCCAVSFPGSFKECLYSALNQGGRTACTGAAAGYLSGAMIGLDALQEKFTGQPELCSIILELADDMFESSP